MNKNGRCYDTTTTTRAAKTTTATQVIPWSFADGRRQKIDFQTKCQQHAAGVN